MIIYRPRLSRRQREALRSAAEQRAYTIALDQRAKAATAVEEDEDPIFEARTRAYKELIARALELPEATLDGDD